MRQRRRHIPARFQLWQWGSVTGLLLLLSVAVSALLPSDVAAHATLLSTSPNEGEVIDSPPQEVVLTFNEPVRPTDGGMRLFDPTGNEVDLTGTARDAQVVVPLPVSMGEGTWTFGWRVISADGHPISGAFTFSIGSPSDTVADIAVTQPSPLAERVTSVVQGLGYVGLLVALGLTIFQLLVLQSSTMNSAIRSCTAGAALLGASAWLVLIPLSTVRQQGYELSSVFRPSRWGPYVDHSVIVSSAMVTVGLALLLAAMWVPAGNLRRLLELTGVVLAVLGPTWSGHTRVFTPTWMFGVSNVVHTAVGAMWLGGLIGLAITLSRQRQAASDRMVSARLAAIVARFSTVAGAALGLLILTGLVSGWLVLGGVRPFVESTYGRLVLLKLGLVAIVALVAAWNRFRLVPVIVARKSSERDARRHLYRLAALEGAVLIVVAVVTGFLVNQSPPTTVAAPDEAESTTMAIDLPLGNGSVVGTASPVAPGTNIVIFEVLDEHGEPLTPESLPTVQASLPSADLGPLTGAVQETDTPSTYRAEVDLPVPGAWEIALIVRVSTFEEPIARFTMELPATPPQHDDHDHAMGDAEGTAAAGTGTVPHVAQEYVMDHEVMAVAAGKRAVHPCMPNRGDQDDWLLGGVTGRAERTEFHGQIIDGAVASMRPIEGSWLISAGRASFSTRERCA